jgi:hypothetical protein
VGPVGLEPTRFGLKVRCSTVGATGPCTGSVERTATVAAPIRSDGGTFRNLAPEFWRLALGHGG